MKRFQLIEIHSLPWCPAVIRESLTGVIQFFTNLLGFYQLITPNILSALKNSRTKDVLDLCSGSGGPWRSLIKTLPNDTDGSYRITLSDFAPNVASIADVKSESNTRIAYLAASVDATQVPSNLKGFRTIFAAFHHFEPTKAKNILQNAVDNNVGIGIFEITERKPSVILSLIFGGIAALIAVPFLRPFSWTRLFLTYVVPIIPFVVSFDGVVSCLRTYTTEELKQLIEQLDAPGYQWDIGQRQHKEYKLMNVSYLIGYPAEAYA